jgi:hypothetical protein
LTWENDACESCQSRDQKGTFWMRSCHTLDQLDTCFDETHTVANAGLLLSATLAQRLVIEQAADALIDLGERAGAHRQGRKLLTLVHSMLTGADCIDDTDLLRCGATSQVLGHRVMAPSTRRDVPALVHLRARLPARPAHRAAAYARVGGRRRPPVMGR